MNSLKYTFLSLAVLSLALSSAAKERDKSSTKPIDLTGSWKEARRVSPRGEALDYTDTTYYDFLIGNEYTMKRKNAFMYRGTYKANPGRVDLGMRAYNVVEMSPSRMILRDDAGSYQFVRYEKQPETEDNSAASSSGRAMKPEVAAGRVSLNDLYGKWEVFKRTSSTTLSEVDYNHIVQIIELKPRGGDTLGTIAAARDRDGLPAWKITRYDNGTLHATGPKGARQLKVVSLRDGELIVQEDVYTYFFKQFK